jgi:thiamine biosynthesis lipoprotein
MRVVVTKPSGLLAAKAAVDLVVHAMDVAASRFREDSELSRLNAMPGQAVTVSPLLARAISAALRGARLTGGAVDPTVGQAVKVAGYDADFALLPPDGGPIRLVEARAPGWQAVEFHASSRTVLVPRGVDLDLGATAKALAADLAAEAASHATEGAGALVSLGGDIAMSGPAPAEGWLIQAGEDSTEPVDEDVETISITSGGVATSSTTVRRWTRGGVMQHHIIDPATGLPSQSRWRTATVAAGSCVDANIASTAAIVMDRFAPFWLEATGLPSRLVGRDGQIQRVAGWPHPAGPQSSPSNSSGT